MVKISEFVIDDMPHLEWDPIKLLKQASKYIINDEDLKQYK